MKYNLLLPIAGNGQRFSDKGYELPKPLIPTNGKTILERSLEAVNLEDCNLIFVVRQDHINDFSIDNVILKKYPNSKFVVAEKLTDGALSTCLLAKDFINNTDPLLIFTPDCYFEPQIDPTKIEPWYDGLVCVFESNSPAHSYVKLNENNLVVETAEKEVISNLAIGGLYYFKEGKSFVDCAEHMIENNIRTKGEFYIAPVFNLLIDQRFNVGIDKNTRHDILGTPEDLEKVNER